MMAFGHLVLQNMEHRCAGIRTPEYNFFSRKNYEAVPRQKFFVEKILSRGRNSLSLRICKKK
jgi:hypothetical protein